MTDAEACVLRQDTPRCNRDCKKCDLLLPTEDVLTAYDMAIKALEQQPCEDTISRQAAIDAIESAFDRETILNRFVRKIAISAVRKLPSAQPEIVRCRDCKYGEQDEVGRWFCRSLGCQIGNEDGSGFCSDAERRTKDEDTL